MTGTVDQPACPQCGRAISTAVAPSADSDQFAELYAPEAWIDRIAACWHELGDKRAVLLVQLAPRGPATTTSDTVAANVDCHSDVEGHADRGWRLDDEPGG